MKRLVSTLFAALLLVLTAFSVGHSIQPTAAQSAPIPESMGALEFGPDNVLFIADSIGAQVLAVDVDEAGPNLEENRPVYVESVDVQIAALLGTTADEVLINDIIASPSTQNVYLSVQRGRGPDAEPVLVRVVNGEAPQLEVVELDGREITSVDIPSAPGRDERLQFGHPTRVFTITDLHFHDGELLVSGVSNEEFASTLRRIPYPFTDEISITSLEVFHAVHNQFETQAPIVTMQTYELDGETYLFAAYTCTPLVRFNLDDLVDGEHVVGETVAEMGYGNAPIDMILYKDTLDGQEWLLVTHDQRTPTRVSPTLTATAPALPEEFSQHPVGLDQLPVAGAGSLHMAPLNERQVVVVRRHVWTGNLNLMTLTNGIFADFSESVVEMNWPDEAYPEEWANWPGGFVINDFDVSD